MINTWKTETTIIYFTIINKDQPIVLSVGDIRESAKLNKQAIEEYNRLLNDEPNT